MNLTPAIIRGKLRAAAKAFKAGPALFEYSTYDQYLYGPEDTIIQNKGVDAYIDMANTDAEIANDINQYVLLAIPDVSVTPGGDDPEDKRNADLMTALISNMHGADLDPFAEMLANAVKTGMSVAEPMLIYSDIPGIGRVVGMESLYTRPTRSFTEATHGIEVNQYGQILKFNQSAEFGSNSADPEEVIYYAHKGGPENRYGTSILRPCYEPWAAKIKVRRVYQVFMVTNASGIRHAKMPAEDFNDKTKRQARQSVMEKLKSLN